MSSSLFNIEKLDEKNYDSWCVQVRSILIHSELWKVVSGSLKKTQANSEEWQILDEKALATLLLSVKPTQVSHIKNCKTSEEAWKKLESIYKPKGPARKVTLYKTLLSLRLSEDENVMEFLHKFSDIVEKLAEVEIVLNDEMLGIILLSSLPHNYEGFVIAIESRDSLPSFASLKVKLTEECERRKSHQSNEQQQEQQAYSANHKYNGFYKQKNKIKTNKNTTNAGNNSNNNNSNREGKCYICGKRGHYANNCRNKALKNEKNLFASTLLSIPANSNKKYNNLTISDSNLILSTFDKKDDNNSLNKSILNNSLWLIDSGASSHMCKEREMFVSYCKEKQKVMVAGGNFVYAEGRGDVNIKVNEYSISLKDVLYVPSLQANFLSVSKCVEKGAVLFFKEDSAIVKDKFNDVLVKAYKKNNLYIFESKIAVNLSCIENSVKWHERFGHLNYQSLMKIKNKNIVRDLDKIKVPNEKCVTCMTSKIITKPFANSSQNQSKKILDLIHSDVCGPFATETLNKSRYFVTFIDDFSKRVFVYFIKTKNEVFEKFKTFKALVETQTGLKIKKLRTDNGREYVNREFNVFLNTHGIQRQLTICYTPQQNGVSERFNRTIVEMARCMLVKSNLGDFLWAEAVATAAHIRNRCPSKAIGDITPYEKWYGKKPSVKHLRIFGCAAAALNKKQGNKLKAKGKIYYMVGYSFTSKGYRLYDPENRTVVERRDIIFDEHSFKSNNIKSLNSTMNINNIESQNEMQDIIQNQDNENDIVDESNEDNSVPTEKNATSLRVGPGRPRFLRTGRQGRPTKQYNVISSAIETEDFVIPQRYSDIKGNKYSSDWYRAVQSEYDSLVKNNTWSLVDLPPGQKPIGCKWIFSLKKNAHGNIERFKARLVAKGFSQQYGVNYFETFSPVVRYATIRMVIAIAAKYKMHLHQLDVTTAYLNSDLQEECYMKQPDEFIDQKHPNKVLKLNKALYGLKQSGREWNFKLDSVLKGLGFIQCDNEPCLYKKIENDNTVLIAVYVDDLIIACSSKAELNEIKQKLANEFDLVDKGPLKFFLGMEVERQGEIGNISVGHKKYIENLLAKYV